MRRVPVVCAAGALLAAAGWFGASHALAATLGFSPDSGSVAVGHTVTVTLQVDTVGATVNAIGGTVTWSPATLALESVSTDDSVLSFWSVKPEVSDTSSVIFAGGMPSPGFEGTNGAVLLVVLRAVDTGTATVSVSGAKVLANDGHATDVLTGSTDATLSVVNGAPFTGSEVAEPEPGRPAPVLSSSTHPDPARWYAEGSAAVTWTEPKGLTGVSYDMTDDPNTVPDTRVETTGTSATLKIPSEGVWYFHLRGRFATGWSVTVHRALLYDHTPPEPFVPTVLQDRGPADPTPALAFDASDAVSGIARYAVRIDGWDTVDAATPFELAGTSPGYHTATVFAYDQAGNAREGSVAFITVGYPAPILLSVSSPLILLDPLVVRGTAGPGDTVVVNLNGREVGRTVLAPGAGGRGPWSVTSDRLLRPGRYTVTATATSSDGKTSITTDPYSLRVVGWALILRGRPVATISVATPVGILLVLLLAGAATYLVRTALLNRRMHRGIRVAEGDLEVLRTAAEQPGGVSTQGVEAAVDHIEQELGEPPRPRNRQGPPKP